MDENDINTIPEDDEEDSLAALIDLLREDGAQACITQFITHKRESAKEKTELELKRLELRKETFKRSTWFFWIVSGGVVAAITALTAFGKIDGQIVGTLYGAIVGYLFGRLKKD